MKKQIQTLLLVLMLASSFAASAFAQITSNGTGGGDWNTGTTWTGGLVPTAADNVIIAVGDSVSVLTSAVQVCNNLTVNGKLADSLDGTGLASSFTVNGLLTLAPGSYLWLGKAVKVIPGATNSIAATNTVNYYGTQTSITNVAYGNLTLSGTGSVALSANTTINGNLTITGTAKLRGVSATGNALTHTIGGNVYLNATSSPTLTAANGGAGVTDTATFMINGNVTIDAGRLSCLESGYTTAPGGVGTFNINGDLTINGAGIVQMGSSTSFTIGTATVNVKGNVNNNTTGTSAGIIPTGRGNPPSLIPIFNFNFVGTSQQTYTGNSVGTWTGTTGVITRLAYININNPAGVALGTLVSNVFNINNNVTLTMTNGSISVGGNAIAYPGTGTALKYAGATAQVTGSELLATIPALIINNSAGVTLNAATMADSLALTNGNLVTTGTNLLTLSANKAVPVSGGSATSFVNGPLAISYATAGGLFSKTYPIGKGSIYRPITLSLTQADVTPSTYTAEMINSAPAANLFPGTLSQTEPNTASKVRYYTISENGGGSTFIAGTVTLSYGADEAVTDMANLRVAQGPVGGGGTWTDLAGSGSANGTGTILSTSFFTALTNTAFTLANNLAGTNPLPVEMTSFTAITKVRGVELVWKTATEVNNMGFEIEKNVNGSWSKIAFVEGSGTTNIQHAYSYVDANVFGEMQYRLKQIDRDGKFSYSNTVEAIIALTAEDYKLGQNYPNPFNPTTNIYFALKNTEHATVTIYNMLGQHVATLFNGEATANQMYSLTFDAKDLSSGIYFYSLQSATRNEVKKMMLMK
jgi:hypothetical protein